MADPTAVADAQGEFLELGNPGPDTLRLDSLRIDADAQSLILTDWSLAPGGLFLICRDSLPGENGGMACLRQWGALSLANTRGTAVELSWKGGANAYSLAAPKPGVSWENTWEADQGYRRFLPSAGARPGGDSATPGYRNSRSVLRAERDLGIVGVTWIPARPGASGSASIQGEGTLEARVADLGTAPAPRTFLSLRLDADWDGVAETPIDSLPVDMPSSGEAVLRIGMGAGLRGIVRVSLGADGNPANDVFLLPVEPGRPLAITEWRPAPSGGEPEWVEIRNRTADSGGIGRRLDPARAAFNGLSLGSAAGTLDPGEFLVLTESLERFRARYGAIKARLLQPAGWRPLRNSGDTLVLSLAGFTVDSVIYDASGAAVIGGIAAPGGAVADSRGAAGTPGFAGATIPENGWALSGRVAGAGRVLDAEIRIVPGGRFALRVFDLEGDRVRDLGRGGAGRTVVGWDGRGDGGLPLKPGPYILCLSIDGAAPKRVAVVLAGDR